MKRQCRALVLLFLCSVITFSIISPPALLAQGPAASPAVESVIRGVVRDHLHRPVRGAEVMLADAGSVVRTDDAGAFVLRVPAGAAVGEAVLRVRAEGYRDGELRVVIAPGAVRADVVLTAQAVSLDPVTATAGSAPRAGAARFGEVDAVAVAASASVQTLSELLQARVPGVSIFDASGSPGIAAQIRIRGVHSIFDRGPAVYMDGVRVEGLARESSGGVLALTAPLAGVALEEIESVEVLRGVAATLWSGPDAATGAIHLTTRQGVPGAGMLRQRMVMEYGVVEPDLAFPDNWVRCGDVPAEACAGQPAELLLRDNPLRRTLGREQMASLNWTGQGGGETVAYFGTIGWGRQDGIIPGSGLERKSGRVNLRFTPGTRFEIRAGVGGGRTETGLPANPMVANGLLGSPHTVGGALDGWYDLAWKSPEFAATRVVDGTRLQPTVQVMHRTLPWLTQRLIAGADLVRQDMENDRFDLSDEEDGWIRHEQRTELRTVSYLAEFSRIPGVRHDAGLSLGVQLQSERDERELLLVRVIPGSEDLVSGEERRQTRDLLGFVVQGQYGYRDRLFFQAGTRLDRTDGWAGKFNSLLSPRAGISYILSESAFWEPFRPVVGTLRLHGAWGRAERDLPEHPIIRSILTVGAVPASPRPERNSEIEFGVEAALLDDRVGVEWTIFRADARDLLILAPTPPSGGSFGYQLQQGGALRNQGMELGLGARLLSSRMLAWDARVGISRLENRVTSMSTPGAGWTNQAMEGYPISSTFTRRILEVDPAAGRVMVSDTVEYVGNPLPRWEGSFASELLVGQRIRISGLLDWRAGYTVHNQTSEWRDRSSGNSERWAKRNELPASERLRYFGPYHDSNGSVPASQVQDPYFQDGRFLRLREISLSYDLPGSWAGRIGARAAALTLGGRNLALWTAYDGADPEVLPSPLAVGREDHFALPQVARWTGRVTIHF